ncbi:SGNH/GDSL hydrolase family protein [Roseococcus sp. DSY-14]|uniref:SGNH/GDSL hydrolase family protein n=1 Tax=Roseococcus sp. DSY-14 TaxID=3369650 RepID=UPI00387B6849
MRNWIAAITLALCAAATPPPAKAAPYTAEYVFGDSLSDTGNLLRLAAANPAAFQGVALPLPPYLTGRYSNGPVWVEGLAQSLGLPLQPSLAGGTNFSFAGALTGGGSIPGVAAQAAGFLAATGGAADPQALYILGGGGNDLRRATSADLAIAQNAADNIAAALAALYAAGARNFLVATPPDVSLLPEVQGTGAALAAVRALRAFLGEALRAELLADLAAFAALRPDAQVTSLDIFGLLRDAVADPARYGFTNVVDACLDAASQSVCSTPGSFLFWDGIHPTAAGHDILAQAALAALVPVPEPAALGLLAAALLALGLAARPGRRAAAAQPA